MNYFDERGNLFFPVKNHKDFQIKQCTISRNKLNVFRGIHINTFDKIVTCIQGKILDIIIDMEPESEKYLIPQYFNLDPNTDLFELFVPKNFGHAFLSLEENSILVYHFNGLFSSEETLTINYLDPYIKLKLTNGITFDNLIISEKDNIKKFSKPIDYVIFGSNGFLGSNIIRYLENKNYIICNFRLEETNEIEKYLKLYSPKYVINCAGITGDPNILWCDDNKTETIAINITYQLTLADICKKYNIHLTILGSGGIFENDKYYSESEEGNFHGNFYGECRITLEKMIKNYPNVLYLRINYPISKYHSNKNLLTKILGYKRIDNISLTITCIDDLFPILLEMIENNETGITNFVNPGEISLVSILEIYNRYKFHSFVVNNGVMVEDNKRSVSKLECEKILEYNPLDVFEAVDECVKNY